MDDEGEHEEEVVGEDEVGASHRGNGNVAVAASPRFCACGRKPIAGIGKLGKSGKTVLFQ